MSSKSVNVYYFKQDKKFIVHPLQKIKDFISIASKPYIIEREFSFEKLLESIIYALDFSSETVFRPSDWKEFQDKHLQLMGLKSLTMLHKNSISLNVRLNDDTITFVPTINRGSREGFVFYKDDRSKSISITESKEKIIGVMIEAIESCG